MEIQRYARLVFYFILYAMDADCENCGTLQGAPVSPGVAYGEVFIAREAVAADVPTRHISPEEAENEWKRFEDAVEISRRELSALKDGGGKEQREILDAQLLMLSDPEFLPLVKSELDSKLVNIEAALRTCIRSAVSVLRASGDDYLAARATDIEDAFGRVMAKLTDSPGNPPAGTDAASDGLRGKILVARNISPSYAVSLKNSGVAAILMEEGGAACHVAILARSWNIPAVMGVSGLLNAVASLRPDEKLFVDGRAGVVRAGVSPSEAEERARAENAGRSAVPSGKNIPFKTKDGVPFVLSANIALPDDCPAVLESGADGVGLFRSEFLFLRDGAFSLADEESQFEAYAAAAKSLGGATLTVRTLDVGGDKSLPSQVELREKNPLLGWRALRFCLDETDVFQTQLRAIVRASAFGDVRVLFPMVATAAELDAALAALERAKASCRRDGFAFNADMQAGVMIEIPSAAVCADVMAKRVSFMSIGSNDLIQYTMAADRENSKVAYLYNGFDPAVLRLIKNVVAAGEAHGTEVSVCGEMGGDPISACLLFGMGVRKFSMSPSLVEHVARALSSFSSSELKGVAETVLAASTAEEAGAVLKRGLEKEDGGGVSP